MNNLTKQKVKLILEKYWLIPFLAIRSLLRASIELVWCLIPLGLLGWLIIYIKKGNLKIDNEKENMQWIT